MSEESKMDKKSMNRSSQPQSRVSAVDCKKPESTYKPWPRNHKKREGTTFVPKSEPNRKNVSAPRARGQIDKRPRCRGNSNGFMGGTENTGIVENEEPEIGSVFTPGSKKQNLNHLLNFMYPSRGGTDHRDYKLRRQVHHHRFVPHKQEHDQYLRAHCQFVVKDEEDYNLNLLDPDVPVKWDKIEEIVVRGTGRSECPICLGAPVAARVGPCGHMYCWACVLHYVAAHDKQPPPCPVCTTPMTVSDMKPARMVQWQSADDEVTMRLVRRLRGSTIVELAPLKGEPNASAHNNLLPVGEIANAPFAKLFTATKQEVRDILNRERQELENQILAEIDTSELVYLEQALQLLRTKEEKVDKEYVVKNQLKINEQILTETVPMVFEKQPVIDQKLDWFDVNEEGAATGGIKSLEEMTHKMDNLNMDYHDLDNDVGAQSNLNPNANEFTCVPDIHEDFPLIHNEVDKFEANDKTTLTEHDKDNQAKYFYFYQAEDGQQVFLNSLNVRILNASWGALVAAPTTIRGRILHRQTLPLLEETRKHMPHTAHLPLHCSFDIVELDLQPPYITETALVRFAGDLERRARARAKHEREERRRERACRRAMEGPPKPDFTSELVFPPAASSCPVFNEPLPSTSIEQSPSIATSPSSSGLSFAKMAGTSGTWRVRKTVTPPPPPPAVDDASAPRTMNLSDAIEAAFNANVSPKGKKNKKSKQKVLFATGMQHTS